MPSRKTEKTAELLAQEEQLREEHREVHRKRRKEIAARSARSVAAAKKRKQGFIERGYSDAEDG